MAHRQRIGIMADSHGRHHAIAAALAFFRLNACSRVYHLGDICDSSSPQTVNACADLLRRHRVMAIKGNNDHTLVVNHEGNSGSIVSTDTIDYLKQLPLVLFYKDAVLSHGLPFVEEKGLSCMIGTLNPWEFSFFVQKYPRSLLFRGHQHYPEIVWQQRGQMTTRKILPGSEIHIRSRIPCIVTCGALDNGFCMIWEPEKSLIACHRYS